ncbi:MAG: hypothetical protein ACKOQ4_07170 [Mycobacterium sp.]
MRRTVLLLTAAASAAGLVVASPAAADCNTVTGSTLCASGTVKGSSGAPTSVPAYDPYPCYGNPACDFYDDYNPGIIWDLPNIGGGNRPRPR